MAMPKRIRPSPASSPPPCFSRRAACGRSPPPPPPARTAQGTVASTVDVADAQPPSPARPRGRVVSVRARAAARRFALATLLALGAGEARAAAVCSDTPGPNDRVYCTRAFTTNVDIDIDLTNRAIATSGVYENGFYAVQRGSGAIFIGTTGGSIATTGARNSSGIAAWTANAANAAALAIRMTRGSVNTSGSGSHGIDGVHTGAGRIDIDMTSGSISTRGDRAYGILGNHRGAGGVDIDMRGGSVATTGEGAFGVYGLNYSGTGGIDIDVTDGSIATTGASSRGITAWIANAANEAAIAIGMTRGSVDTSGSRGHGIYGVHAGAGRIAIDMTSSSISTTGSRAYGIHGYHSGAGGVDIAMRGGSVMTTGERAHGVYGLNYSGVAGGIDIDVTGGSVMTTGERAHGVYGVHAGAGAGGIDIDMTGGTVTAVSQSASGIQGFIHNAANEAAISIDVTGGTVVGEGLFGYGAYGAHDGLGSASLTTGAEARIKAPFSIGVAGGLANAANAAGRLVVAHGGAVEARNVGLQAWVTRWNGHTFGAGAQTADGADRTEPMIAVVSSGTVTVGASVTDAFVRDRIAGADETLSAAESAVLDAVAAGDSDALDTALAALPPAYDAAWKAEARNLMGKLAAEPSAAVAAYRAADEILGLSRAGVRAAALSHHRIATFVRQGDRDPAILATAAEDRTPPQQAALAEQEKLSAAERTVLAAILTGGDSTAALAALPASAAYAYTEAWKDGVRQHAASYNAGGIRVDVTAGSIAAEGNGVEAFYAVPHDRNGAIAVTVAEGARVTGSRHGVHVRGAGAGEENFRAQSVTVNGAVTGGTGAGVHMAGGGRLTVGKTGRVGATSGVGVLADGPGDLHATVAGTVDGDIRSTGAGTLTLAVPEGGAVTGTVHDPVGLPTVVGSIGRLLYSGGATVTVARTGSLTGVEVEGRTEALRSDSGDLSLTVADMGMVTGDVQARGGRLTLDLKAGGTIAGTVHDPAGPLTVAGSIGRLLYANGATVTVARTGRLTGVEVEGRSEALRSEAGDLDLTVAGMVTGDVFGLGAGEHTVTVSNGGTVTGTVDLAASTVTVHGRAGRVRFDDGGTVTVGSTGWITGIEDAGRTEAIRNEAGDLVVNVAGRITGDVIDLGARPSKITTERDSTVAGNIDVAAAGSEVRVDGTVAGRIRFRRGGMVTVGRDGKVEGWVSRNEGELVAVIERRPEETTRAAAVGRAFPGGIDLPHDEIRLEPELADHEPRMRVYEALPSVLLGLNRLPEFRDRMAAPRTADGAGWARVETFRGKWKADESTTPGLEYDHRRHGLKAGVDAKVGEHGLLGVSLHHRRGTAEVSGGGDVKLSGHGVGMSGAWLGDAGYVDVQAEATWYEADLSATGRGVLKTDVPGRGHALGVEVGRRVALERLPAGMVLTPRAGLVHSKVSMGGFTDAAGARVSMEDGRSLKGRAGMAVEMEPGGASGSRVFGTVDMEHEFSRDTKVVVSGTELKSEAEATWLRLGLNGVHAWDEGRSTVQGGVSYATGGGHELGGGVSLKVRF